MTLRPPSSAPIDTVEGFARLVVLLDDPFADRAALLEAAGLDEAGWRDAMRRWTGLIESSDDALVDRFVAAYRLARHEIEGAGASVSPTLAGPAFLSCDAQPWREQAAAVPLAGEGTPPPFASAPDAPDTEPDPFSAVPPALRTAEVPAFLVSAVLPFTPARGPGRDPSEETLESPAYVPAESRVMPFSGPPPSPKP